MGTPTSNCIYSAHARGLVPQEIEVRWELPGGRIVWWVAFVRKVQAAKCDEVANASAVLEYEAGHGFPHSSYQVRFRNTLILEHTLSGGDNNVAEWRARRKPKLRVKRKVLRLQKVRQNKIENQEENINTLRKEIMRNSRHLQVLQTSLNLRHNELMSHELKYVRRREREVLEFITPRMAIELRKAPRNPVRTHHGQNQSPTPQCEQTRQGITRMSVRISADCGQRIFETIAERIQENSHSLRTEPFFQLPFELTQLPSEGCKHFSVIFGSFADLCKCIGINSMSDRLLMTCQYGLSKGEGIMRVLGTIEQDFVGDDLGPEFFAASSCGHKYGSDDSADTLQRSVSVKLRYGRLALMRRPELLSFSSLDRG